MISKTAYKVKLATPCGCRERERERERERGSLFGDQTGLSHNVTALEQNKNLPLNTLSIIKIIKKTQINKKIKDRAKACKNCMLYSSIFFSF